MRSTARWRNGRRVCLQCSWSAPKDCEDNQSLWGLPVQGVSSSFGIYGNARAGVRSLGSSYQVVNLSLRIPEVRVPLGVHERPAFPERMPYLLTQGIIARHMKLAFCDCIL